MMLMVYKQSLKVKSEFLTHYVCSSSSPSPSGRPLLFLHIHFHQQQGQRLRHIVMTVNNEIISIIVSLNKYPNLFVFIDLHQCNYSTLAELAEEHYVTMH